jgi:hypothetical protein
VLTHRSFAVSGPAQDRRTIAQAGTDLLQVQQRAIAKGVAGLTLDMTMVTANAIPWR